MLGLAIHLLGLVFYFALILFVWSVLIFDLFGPPAVPTPLKIVEEILKEVSPQKNVFLIDLGSGTGRVVKMAVKKYGVKGLGIEINPFLIWWSKISAYFGGLKNIEFKRGNFFKSDLSGADIIFMYLLPKYLPVIASKIKKECQAGTLVISQRFVVEALEKYLVKEMKRKHNSSYIYLL